MGWRTVIWLARFVPRLAFSLISALGLAACSGEGGPADLRWEINFKCTTDATLTDHVHVQVLRDGCGGSDEAYDTMLLSGETGPEQVLPPGEYTLQVTALSADDIPLAFACKDQELPARRLEIWLASDSCSREIAEMDAGEMGRVLDAGADEDDDSTDEVPLIDASVCPEGGCQDGCKIDPGPCACSEFNGHSYLMCSGATTWAEARKACKALGTDLALIDSHEENSHIAAQASGMTSWIGANDRGDDGKSFSLIPGPGCDPGCRRPPQGDEGIWKWVDTAAGKEAGPSFCSFDTKINQCPSSNGKYANWGAGEPNNTVPADQCGGYYPSEPCNEGEDCGAMANGGSWQDLDCKASLPYVCETR